MTTNGFDWQSRGVAPLEKSSDVLARVYDAALFDLDGVIYVGRDSVPGVVSCINQLHTDFGLTLTYVTNNASRSPASVADHLRELGLAATPEDVVTSAQAGAAVLATLVPQGSSIFVLGSRDLMAEVELVGLVPSQDVEAQHAGVIEGYWPDMPWRMLAQASHVLSTGVPWVATNMDITIPTQWGMAPGNGAMVNALAQSVGRRPTAVAGKPEVPLMQQSIERAQSQRPLVVGDRLDTDIQGANNVGIDSLLVFSGVTSVRELLAAPSELRPTYVAWDATGLADSHHGVDVNLGVASLDGWQVSQGSLIGQGDILDAIRVVAVAVWNGVLSIDDATSQLSERGIAVG